jgi:hypothetical protein
VTSDGVGRELVSIIREIGDIKYGNALKSARLVDRDQNKI